MAEVKVDLGVGDVIEKVEQTETFKSADKTSALVVRAIKAALQPLEIWVMQREYNLEETRKLLEKKLENVAAEKINTPPSYIGVPVLQAISYCMNDEELCNMYAELLAHSMNSDTVANVHPTYVEIIKQMAPLDAKVFKYFASKLVIPCLKVSYAKKGQNGYPIVDCFAFDDLNAYPIVPTQISIQNLERLRLIEVDSKSQYGLKEDIEKLKNSDSLQSKIKQYIEDNKDSMPPSEFSVTYEVSTILVRAFGQYFARACMGIDYTV